MWNCWILGLLFALPLMAIAGATEPTKHVVCYQGTWSVYRPKEGKFGVEDIDPFLCTHLVYAFLGIQESGELRVIDPYLDLEDNGGLGNIKKFNALKLKNPTLKTLVAVGGWNEGSKRFSIVANDPEKRSRFVEQVVQFIQRHGFDGLDLDWEYPGQRHNLNENNDRENYVALLKELKAGLNPFGYILSAAVGSAEFSASISYDIPAISEYLDIINVMAYDLHGPWDESVGINAPLYAGANDTTQRAQQLNVDAVITYWIDSGAPLEKLILGVPFYGRTFTLASAEDHLPGAAHIGRGIAGPYSREPGVLGYNELCELFQREQWTLGWEAMQQVPFAFRERQWVGYENTNSLRLKAQYAMDHKLGGIMIWSLESDDFHGSCGGESFPLLRNINRVLFGRDNPTGLAGEKQQPAAAAQSGGGVAESSCHDIDGYVKDPNNCSKFYYCSGGATFMFNCPSGLVFDTNTNSCNYVDLVEC
ncbi:chitinase-3-like protein 1 [Drosophila navojoa]|uniref:chitinase-3-like protein 1 n=1 Tax=Drosophila navojoa TaxID=7232 RepID=UPI0008469CAF|nr:chitinase-3-like protein 1 [Drosophila navojoa]